MESKFSERNDMAEGKRDSNDDNEPRSELQDEWMIRPCSVYEEEYSDCTSIRARFHQYFVFGRTLDCSQWKRDCDNCYRWYEKKDLKSAKELIKSEKIKRKERLGPHYNNTTWERRKAPPENWNTPLPDYIQKEYEHSYLNLKAKEMRGEAQPALDPTDYCVIM